MESFYASASGVLAIFGALAFLYFLLRKDIQNLKGDLKEGLQKAEEGRLRIETDLKEGLQKAEEDRLRIKADLEGDIGRVEDRLIKVDERGWKMEGDMKVVKHILHITETPPADPEPTRPRPARETTGRRQSPAAPVTSKT